MAHYLMVKFGLIWAGATAAAWVSGRFVALFADAEIWWQHPAIIAATVAAVSAFILKRWDLRNQRLRDEEQDEQDEIEKSQTQSDKMAELTQTGWQVYLSEVKQLHGQEIAFAMAQVMAAEVAAFRDREIKHRFAQECQRLQQRIRDDQLRLKDAGHGPDVVDFNFKYHDEIVDGVEKAVEEFRRNLSGAADKTGGQ